MTPLDAALVYISRGWNPTPVELRTKKPIGEEWQNRIIDAGSAPKFFNGQRMNIGVVLGASSKGLTDIDLDCAEAIIIAPYILPATKALFGRSGKRNSHMLYYTDLAASADTAAIAYDDPNRKGTAGGRLVELRIGSEGHGAQTVFPPSIHKTGEPIKWEIEGEPAKVDGANLQRKVSELAACCLLARYWPNEGSGHHDAARVVGGFLARAGKAPGVIRILVEAIGKAACSARWRELARTAEDAAKAHTEGRNTYGLPALRDVFGKTVANKIADWLQYSEPWPAPSGPAASDEDEILARLNAEYCVVRDGAKTRVLSFEPHIQRISDRLTHHRLIPIFESFEDFRNFHANQRIAVGDKFIPLGKWWLNHPQRRQYAGVTFQPGQGELVEGRLNLWRGWGVQPMAGDWQLMRRHIAEVLANGDEEADDYIVRWLAWAVQHPAERAQVAPVFRGGRGTGKGTLGNTLCVIFGQHGAHISSADHIGGRFNSHLRDACFLFADEAYWPGDRTAEGSLKRLISEPDLFIEAKGRDAITASNMLHVIMASNADWVVPAGEHERRFAVFDVSEDHRQDEAWFAPIYQQLESGGYGAMLFDLLRHDLGEWHPRHFPRTAALSSQQAQSLTPEYQWWVELLETGVLWGAEPSEPNKAVSNAYEVEEPTGTGYGITRRVRRKGLYDQAREISPRLKTASDHRLGSFLRDRGCVNDSKVLRRRGWTFPTLADARADWEARFPRWPWRDPDLAEWQSGP
jgi:hypothetical protein